MTPENVGRVGFRWRSLSDRQANNRGHEADSFRPDGWARKLSVLPVLADAFEAAGCTDAELLGHLRGPGAHVRGCWALDLILSKE